MMEQPQNETNPALETYIRQRIEASGAISFAEFMEHCLYHPQYGYYMAERDRIGKGGDFFTSSSVHALFGRLIARQLIQMWEVLGKGSFTIAEQGAGEGHLALDILDAIEAEAPELYGNLRYCLVEISPDHQDRQRRLLQRHGQLLSWCPLEELEGMTGCFLSNELVDAFPVHLVEKCRGEYQEVFVTRRDGELMETLRPLTDAAIPDHFRLIGVEPVDGNRVEVNLAATRWMRQVGALLGRGFVLTIDYGYPAAELYSHLRRAGTLMCYYRHTAGDSPYVRIGCQDITSHVDFTALQRAGETVGLQTAYFGEQYRFLMSLGFVEALVALQAQETDENRARALRLTLKNLILPEGGMGETFKVLIQSKGVGTPQLLCGRRITDLPLPPLPC